MAIWQPYVRQACQSHRGEKEEWLNSGLTPETERENEGGRKRKQETNTDKKQEKDNKNLRLQGKKLGLKVTLADMKTTKVDLDMLKMGGSSITEANTRSVRQTCFRQLW